MSNVQQMYARQPSADQLQSQQFTVWALAALFDLTDLEPLSGLTNNKTFYWQPKYQPPCTFNLFYFDFIRYLRRQRSQLRFHGSQKQERQTHVQNFHPDDLVIHFYRIVKLRSALRSIGQLLGAADKPPQQQWLVHSHLFSYITSLGVNEHLGLVTHLPLSNTDTAHPYTFFFLPNEPKTQ